jgi:RimJ/RimL family protein N-acetyltransferase
MQAKPTTQLASVPEPKLTPEQVDLSDGQIRIEPISSSNRSEVGPFTGRWCRFAIRGLGSASLLLYIILSQDETSSRWYWSLLLIIGWYGWWETSLQMKKSEQGGQRKSARQFVRQRGARQITLLPQTPEHLRILLEGIDCYQDRFQLTVAEGVRDFLAGPEVSAEFLARLRNSAPPDPWKDGFAILHNVDKTIIGLCGFTGPPGSDGAVEIAYGIAPAYQNRGLAGEAARELIAYAMSTGQVRTIRAHTRPENNASTRVLTRCGFTRIGAMTHPEDGVVWRWEAATS